MSGSVLGKRDIGAASESEKEESKGQSNENQPQQSKKRRIAPTLVSGGNNDNPDVAG